MGSPMVMVLGDNGSFSSIKIYMMAAICLTYIVCSTVGIVIPTTVSVIFHFDVPKGLFSFFNILSFPSQLHCWGCTDYPPSIYIFFEVDTVIHILWRMMWMSLTLNDFQRMNGIVNLSIFQFCLKMNRKCVNHTFGHTTLGMDVYIREDERNKTIMENKINNLVVCSLNCEGVCCSRDYIQNCVSSGNMDN